MPNAASSLFDDPGDIGRSPGKRVDRLGRVTDVVLSEVDRPNEEQIGMFGGRFLQPIKIEAKTPAKIRSRRRRRR
jgi:hypothetical protein